MGIKNTQVQSDIDHGTKLASEVVQEYLDERGWYSSHNQRAEEEDEVVFMLEFAAEHVASVPVKIVSRDKANQLLFIAACPYVIPDKRKIEMIGKVTDLNRSIAIGAFVLALDEKILTFRTGIDFLNAEQDLNKHLLDCQTKVVFETMDEFMPEFTELFFAGGEPVQTLEDYFEAKRNLQ
jgi:hypothetical protein